MQMLSLFANPFFFEIKDLRWNNDYEGISKKLEENRSLKNLLCNNHKFLKIMDAICCFRLEKDYEQALKGFERALQLKVDSEIETNLLNAHIYFELAVYYEDLDQLEDALKLCKQANQMLEQIKTKVSNEYFIKQYMTELQRVIEYSLAYIYLPLGHARYARDHFHNVMQMCVKSKSLWLLDKCYVLEAIYYSRSRSIRGCETSIDTAKKLMEITDNKPLESYIKNMERIIKLHKKGVWGYNGKKLTDYEHQKKIITISQEIQKHTVDGDIDPIYAKKKQLW